MQSTLLSRTELSDQYLNNFSAPAQSELLTQFYRSYTAWLDDGAPRNIIFSRKAGLCHNLKLFSIAIGASSTALINVRNEMHMQFIHARCGGYYPFDGTADVYEKTVSAHGCHLNEHRIKWVRDHAAI